MKYFTILTFIAISKAQENAPPMSSLKAIDIAAMKMIQGLFQGAKDKTVIASPLGVMTLLAMYSAGTQGQSRNEIMKLVGYTDYDKLQEQYISTMETISSRNPNNLLVANKIFISDNFTLDENFSNVVLSYKGEVEPIDFAQKKNATDRINQWTSERTKGFMTSFGNEEMVDDGTLLALFNIIYFKANLKHPFVFNEADKREFYVDKSKTVKKPMMKLKTCLSYGKDSRIGVRMVELPYGLPGTRMIVVLPDKKDGLSNVLKKLAERGLLESIQSSKFSETDVVLEMPKIDMTSTLDLKKILPKMGVSSIFKEGAAGLVRDQALIVSKAFQKAHVKVEENGATPPADCSAEPGAKKAKSPIQFKVDRPFLYVILRGNRVNFVGTYTR